MKIDLKSIITLTLVGVLALVTLFLIVAIVFGWIPSDNPVVNSITLLFSNSTTMVLTYFFTRKKEGSNEN